MERKDTVTPYETIFIVHPDQGGKVKEYTDRFKKIIEGHYVLVRYQSSARAVEELERNLKLSDGILRYLTVRLDEDAKAPARPRQAQVSEEGRKSPEEDLAKPEP